MKRSLVAFLMIASIGIFSGCDDVLDEIGDLLGNFEQTEESFKELSDLTGGEQISAQDAEALPQKMIEILGKATKDKVGPEVVFLIDKTGSMSDDIDSVKDDLNAILDILPENTRVALATYGDKNEDGDEWFSTTQLTTDYALIRTEIDGIEVTGGGDWEESVYDGSYEVMDQLQWQSQSLRMILVIGDAAPLTGSKTDYSLDDVVDKSQENTPNINIYTIAIGG